MSDSPQSTRVGERIAKLLARAGIASRREIERMIADGRVKLGGEAVTTPATLLTSLAGVTVDDRPVKTPDAARLFAFHKPSGLITAERDPAGRPTIYTALRNALPPGTPRVMPVGRLDLNTEGLLLLTNDGELKRAMELPSSGIPRTYRARTFGDITQARLEELMQGIEIEGIRYGPINANMERRTGRNQWIEMILTEGKNREVRRVLEYLGLQVSRLMRVAYGPFLLGDMPRGSAGEIAPAEVEKFRRSLGLAPQDERAVRLASSRPRADQSKPAPTKAEPEGQRRARPARPGGGPARPVGGAARPNGAAAQNQPREAQPAKPRRAGARQRRPRENEGELLSRGDLPRRPGPARPGSSQLKPSRRGPGGRGSGPTGGPRKPGRGKRP